MNKSITKRTVDTAKPGSKDLFIWDTALGGFGLKVTPVGSKIYVIQYRLNGPTPRRYTIGKHGMWTPDTARKEAKRLLGQVAKGEDPQEKKQSDKTRPTIKIFAKKYLEDYVQLNKKPRSIEEDRRNLEKHVIPVIGTQRIDLIDRTEIQKKIHHPLRHTPTAANRVRSLLLTMFNLAEEWGDRSLTNPIRKIKKYPENKRERRLTKEELTRLGAVLKEAEKNNYHSPSVIGAIQLLLFTGARKNELLTLKWEYVDFEQECLHLPDSKTGKKEVRLNSQAIKVLRLLPHIKENPYVLPGRKKKSHLVNLDLPWYQIRKEAKLEDVRIHDLRRTFGSVGYDAGIEIAFISGLLGHKDITTTQIYTHLSEEPKKKAANQIGVEIQSALDGPRGKQAPVLPFKKKRKA